MKKLLLLITTLLFVFNCFAQALSGNANLTALNLSSNLYVSPEFSSTVTGYTLSVGYGVPAIILSPVTADPNATVKVNGQSVASGNATGRFPLNVGSNMFTTVVTAPDGITTKTYTLLVNKAAFVNTTPDLQSLKLFTIPTTTPLSPAFISSTTSYTASVPNTTTFADITTQSVDPLATVTINGTNVLRGKDFIVPSLAVGQNTFTIVVTDVNADSKTYTLVITWAALSTNNNLTALNLSSNLSVSPSFSSAITNYTLSVGNQVPSMILGPVLAEATSTVKVNGQAVASGNYTSPFPLNVGDNTFTTVVTAQNGSTKTYTLVVTKAPASSNNDLASLTLSKGILSPAFAGSTINYTASVDNSVTSISLKPSTADGGATVKVNGAAVTSGAASAAIPLSVGDNTITTTVTAENGSTKTYTVVVKRLPSSNAELLAVQLSAGTLSPVFSNNITSYTALVANNVTAITVTPVASESMATVKVNGTMVVFGASTSVPLIPGQNTINIAITAEDGTTTKTYNIVITRSALSGNANLTALNLSSNLYVSPEFSSTVTGYTLSVGYGVPAIILSPVTADPNATVKVNGQSVASGNATGRFPLNVGSNMFTTVVTAPDGITTKTYTLLVNKAAFVNTTPDLQSLKLFTIPTTTPLSPAFISSTTSYTASVPNTTTFADITTQSVDPLATVTINGTNVLRGKDFIVPSLAVGQNTFTIVVTDVNADSKTYTLVITRAALSTNNNLTALNLSSNLSVSPSFSSAITNYTLSVGNQVPSMILGPVLAEATSTVKVNGQAVASGNYTSPFPLNVGDNTFTTVVTAQNGSTKTYTLVVTKAPASSNNDLASLTLSKGILSPAFAGSTINYTASVDNSVTSISLKPSTADGGATVKVNGAAVTSGAASAAIPLSVGDNTITTTVTAENGSTKTYTVVVTRQATIPTNADLSTLSISGGSLSPVFSRGVTSYTASVDNSTALGVFNFTKVNPSSTVTINGVTVGAGVTTASVPLVIGANTINIVVAATDGSTKTYTVFINRQLSADANLSDLKINNKTLSPFASGVTTCYTTVNVPAPAAGSYVSVNILPITSDSGATVKILTIFQDGSFIYPVSVGTHNIPITVTAPNGNTKTYNLVITGVLIYNSPGSPIVNLGISSGVLSPAFNFQTYNYTSIVDNSVTSVRIGMSLNDPYATYKINGVTLLSSPSDYQSSASAVVPLVVGQNTIIFSVNSPLRLGDNTYTIVVTRSPAGNGDLNSLSLSSVTPSPAFSPDRTAYVDSVANTVTFTTVTPVASEPGDTIKVNGVVVGSGSASNNIPLAIGENTISTVVTTPGGVTKTYSVVVTRFANPDANLQNVTLSAGTLSPVFVSNTTNYTASVDVPSISVTPITSDSTAMVKVNGLPVASGKASTDIPLIIGSNSINIVVTAQDGTIKTYTALINRTITGDNADLAALTLSNEILSPIFTSNITNYITSVANRVTSVTLTPLTVGALATVKINGETVANGAKSSPIPLNVGDNAITTIVTAQSGKTKTYTVTVTRLGAELASLSVSSGTLSPSFSPGITTYTVSVPSSVDGIAAIVTTADAGSTVKVNGLSFNTFSPYIPLAFGSTTTLSVVVTAQDGITSKTYTINVTRAPASSNADLASLTIQNTNAHLSPGFTSNTTNYTINVQNNETPIVVYPLLSDYTATMTVNGESLRNGSGSSAIPLTVGNNTIMVKVTAQDGITTKTYTVVITRLTNSNALLQNLTLSAGTLSPAFASNIINYTASVNNSTSSVTLTPTVNDAKATAKVKGVTVVSGQASGKIPLAIGANTINTVVTAEDGTIKTYAVIVTRAPASVQQALALNTIMTTDAMSAGTALNSLNLSSGVLSPKFVSSQHNYTASVAYTANNITVTPVVSDADATIKVNGRLVVSGAASPGISLNVGPNTISTVVSAKDGSSKTYVVVVDRAQPLITVNNTFTPNGDGINDTWSIKNIEQFPDCEIKVIDRYNRLMYQAVGYARPWDGRTQNGDATTGTCYYYIDLKHGQGIYTGSVTVVK